MKKILKILETPQHFYALLLAMVMASTMLAIAVHRLTVCDVPEGVVVERVVSGEVELEPAFFRTEYYPPED